MELIEDPRLDKKDLCRETTILAGHEFVCNVEGQGKAGHVHYFIRRYPIGNH